MRAIKVAAASDGLASDWAAEPTQPLKIIWGSARNHVRLIIAVLASGLLLTAAVLAVAGKTFIAVALLQLQADQPRIIGLATRQQNLEENPSLVETQTEILRTPRLAKRVLKRAAGDGVALDDADGWFANALAKLGIEWTEEASNSDEATQAAIEALLDRLDVVQRGRSNIVEVRYRDDTPERAAYVANAFVDEFVAHQSETMSLKNKVMTKKIEEQLNSLAKDLESSEQEIQNFKVANKVLDDDAPSSGSAAQRTDSAVELISVRERLALAENRVREQLALSGNPDAAPVGDSGLLGEAKNELNRLRILEGELIKKINDQSKLRELQRRTEASAELFSLLSRRYKEVSAEGWYSSGETQIVTRAVPPYKAAGLRKVIILALASPLWLAIGVGASVAVDMLRPTIIGAAEAHRTFGLNCIAEIPAFFPGGPCEKVEGPLQSDNVETVLGGPRGEEKNWQEFNQSIFHLVRWAYDVAQHKTPVIAVVSPNRGDGKSTVAAHMARFCKSTNRKVLLIDADWRKGAAGDGINAFDKAAGASTYVSPSALENDNAFPRANEVGDLAILTSASASSRDPLAFFQSACVQESLRKVRDMFDFIIIDTPELANYADSLALMGSVDAAIIIIRHSQTKKEAVRKAIEQLESTQLPTAAIALNCVTR